MKPKLKPLFEKHREWSDVLNIVQRLNRAGHEALIAGGSVRDALLGRNANDFDVATSARPNEIESLFKKTIAVGREFGVIIVPFDDFQVEVATFRKDGPYQDGRRPMHVEYTEAKEDALRRDFTVNALFYDPLKDEVIDYVNGLSDLKAGLLRAVGEPRARFEEDKLRILRAVRLSAQLGFQLEPETRAAVSEFSDRISIVSKERITDEILKLSSAKNLRVGFELLKDTGLFVALWPHLEFQSDRELWQKFLSTLPYTAGSFEMILALLEIFEQVFWANKGHAKEHFGAGMSPFILSKDQKRRVDFLIHGREHLLANDWRGLLDLNENDGPLLTEMCSGLTVAGLFKAGKVAEWIARFLEVADDNGELPKPLLTGEDLLKVGFKADHRLGEALNTLYMRQVTEKIKSRAQLLEIAARLR